MQLHEITPEYRGRECYLTVECPECGGTARTHVPSRPSDVVPVMTCDRDRGGCGARYELTPLPVRDGASQMGIEAQLAYADVDADEIAAELEGDA